MIIAQSNISLSSQRSYRRSETLNSVTCKWQNGSQGPTSFSLTESSYKYSFSSEEEYSNLNYTKDGGYDLGDYVSQPKSIPQSTTEGVTQISSPSKTIPDLVKTAREALKLLLDLLYHSKGLKRRSELNNETENFASYNPGRNIAISTIWNQSTDTTVSIKESESTTFNGSGSAITADGRLLEFDVSFTMSRAFCEEYNYSEFTQYEQILTDPLVISLDSNPPSLSDMHFYFDIDSDGTVDEINSLSSGSGFLALDKNNNGTIDDGSELFGTKSGNGFRDLSEYDLDGNGFIDEADSIYEKLKIWYKDDNGNDVLIPLKEADIGAIYLGNSNTNFSMKEATTDEIGGVMRRSGIFLKESGGSGIISQIDLAIH